MHDIKSENNNMNEQKLIVIIVTLNKLKIIISLLDQWHLYYKNTNKISKIIEYYLKKNKTRNKRSEAHIKLTRILSQSILIQCQNNVFLWAWGLSLNSHCPDFPHYFSTRVHSQTPRPHGTHSMSNNAIFVCLCVCLRGLGGVYDERVFGFQCIKVEK